MDVDFVAVCDAIRGAWAGSGETVTSVAARFGVSQGWIHKWVYPAIGCERLNQNKMKQAAQKVNGAAASSTSSLPGLPPGAAIVSESG